jgi:hypothetical protein
MPSTFDPGTSGSLKAVTLPSAMFEVARLLDSAENTRNGANPGLPPKRNLATTVSFDTGTIAVAATIPFVASLDSAGQTVLAPTDYLAAPYSTFVPGGGDLKSTNVIAAFVELAQLMAAAEKAVTPVEDQPNNVQISTDFETQAITVSCNMPFTTATEADGDVVIRATDYFA